MYLRRHVSTCLDVEYVVTRILYSVGILTSSPPKLLDIGGHFYGRVDVTSQLAGSWWFYPQSKTQRII